MCGIAGLMTKSGAAVDPAVATALIDALAVRGPDGNGSHMQNGVALVQTRLAIIDLATGDQPFSEAGGATLVANGEIYNYRELRSECGSAVFVSESDCEVPLHLYRRYDLEFARHLRGMYALAIYDAPADRLVLCRDPFGIKPLYYVDTKDCFAFASEPEALIRAGIVEAELVRQVRNELLQLQFTTGENTIYAGIKRVLPGETLVISGGRITERHHRAALPFGPPRPHTLASALDQIDTVLLESVRLHQRADVPYGMFLSGGIDSTALLSLMGRLNERPVLAFTAGFGNTEAADERPVARETAKALGAQHIEVDFREGDFWRLLPEIAGAIDDPTADYAILPTYRLGSAVKEAGLKVILSGEGGDELFAGYGRYRSVLRPWWLGGKNPRRRGVFDGLGILRGELTGWRDGLSASELMVAAEGRSNLQIAQATDCADWLPNDLLTKLDRCLMAHGIEGRTPFLDPVVADFAFCLPDSLKIHKGLGKWLLRHWLQTHLPNFDALSRKKGFSVPVAEWIARRGATLGPLVARQPGIREICLPNEVERLFTDAKTKRQGFAAWSLLFYALWHRAHILRLPTGMDVFQALSTAE